jgi:hypothetical protein
MAKFVEKTVDDLHRWVFRFGKEDPHEARSFINDEEVGRVPIPRFDHTIRRRMWLPVVGTGRSHKTEVHIKPLARLTCTACGALSGLFPNTRLFFEIQKPEWMIMKF